jgi:hypothetical protein
VIKMESRLLEVFNSWEDKLAEDEWYFSNSFESICKGLSPEEAFNYIPNVIEMLFKLDDDYLIWETLYFLMQLYSIADTTQIHPSLEKNKYQDAYATPFKELSRLLRIK